MDEPELRAEAEHLSALLLAPIPDTLQPPVIANEEQLEMWSKYQRTTPPVISLADYMARLLHLLKLDDLVKTAIVRYKRQLFQQCGLQLSEQCAHRFVLAAVVVASKCLLDHQYAFTYYARVGGVGTGELTSLEVNLLRLLDWRVFCLD